MNTPILVLILLAAACAVLCTMLFSARRNAAALAARSESDARAANAAGRECLQLEAALAAEQRSHSETKQAAAAAAEALRKAQAEITGLSSALAAEKAHRENIETQSQKSKEELAKLQESFRTEFRNLATEILDEKSKHLRSASKETVEGALNPFRESIAEFRTRVEKIYSEENQQMGALKNEIKNLMDLNRRITEETANLTTALKGNSKTQGDWGEMLLETILDGSNLIKGVHYTTQTTLRNEQGDALRPDVILNLPDRKRIVIDSKVSLTAYVEHCSCEGAEERVAFMRDHVESVRRHVKELGTKRYQDLVDSPDFVIMFIPNEPAFLSALQNAPDLWSEAYDKKVIVSSPTNLFALLKIVDDLWKRDSQSRNAIDIANEGANLYDKFVTFAETLEKLGRNIGDVSSGYEKAMGQLRTGRGNLIARTEKMRKLGLKTSKSLDRKIVDTAIEEDADQ